VTEGLLFATTEEWLKAREKNIGGSEVAALFDVQADYQMSYYTLWQMKSGRIPAPAVSGERINWGLRLEACIADGAAIQNHWTIEKGGYVQHPTVAGMAVSLDFVVTGYSDPAMEGAKPPGAVECKNVDWMIHKASWSEEPPINLQLQLQAALACTGWQWGALVALVGGNRLATYRYERRPKIILEMEKRVAEFWKSVREEREPPVDGSDSTAAALAALFPEIAPGSSIDVTGDNEYLDRHAALRQARLDGKTADAAERAARNWIMRKIGDAELVYHQGEVIATAKLVTRRAHQVAESKSRMLKLKGEK